MYQPDDVPSRTDLKHTPQHE